MAGCRNPLGPDASAAVHPRSLRSTEGNGPRSSRSPEGNGPRVAASSGAAVATGLWSAAEDVALRKAVAKNGPQVPNRWERVAAEVGGGKSKDACKKHSKELLA